MFEIDQIFFTLSHLFSLRIDSVSVSVFVPYCYTSDLTNTKQQQKSDCETSRLVYLGMFSVNKIYILAFGFLPASLSHFKSRNQSLLRATILASCPGVILKTDILCTIEVLQSRNSLPHWHLASFETCLFEIYLDTSRAIQQDKYISLLSAPVVSATIEDICCFNLTLTLVH